MLKRLLTPFLILFAMLVFGIAGGLESTGQLATSLWAFGEIALAFAIIKTTAMLFLNFPPHDRD